MKQAAKNISLIKSELRLSEWSEQIKHCRESGMPVRAWCEKNGLNAKTYYYRLRKIRERICDSPTQEIVPVTKAVWSGAVIVIEACGIKVSIPEAASAETVAAVVRALKC